MDVVSPHTFIVDLDVKDDYKPVPSTLGKRTKGKSGERIKQIDYYPKYEVEFFDTVKECAELIDKLNDANDRLKYTKLLNRIFVNRYKPGLMNMFRELVMKGR